MATLVLPAIAAAAVWTDRLDYLPGSVVTISGDNGDGAGYIPGETVHVDVAGPNGWTAACDASADTTGAWSCQVTLDSDPDVAVGNYTYVATGLASGVSETGTFTDAVNVTVTTPAFAWYTSTTSFDIPVSGTYTCNSTGSACTSITGITVTVPGVAGSKLVTGLSTGSTNAAWSTTLEFRSSPGAGQFAIPTGGKWNVSAVLHTNRPDTADTENDFFGYDAVKPVSTVSCDNDPCAGLYAADVTVRLSASDPGSANTFSGVAATAYCVDLTNVCVPGSPYPGGGGTTVSRIAGATKYVRFFATDAAGNAETLQSQAIIFTADDEAPFVTGTNPTGGAVTVPVATDIDITFSEDVTVGTVNGITVACPVGSPVAGSISGSGDTWTFDPTSDLPAGTTCTVTIHSAQVEDVDLNDPPNTMDNPNYTFTFTTAAANTPPDADAGGPYSGDEGEAIAISGSADDPDGDPLTYLWTIDTTGIDAGGSCVIADDTALSTTVTCDDDSNGGTFALTLTVSGDPDGDVDDDADLTVDNVAPTVALDGSNPTNVTESVTAVTYDYVADDAGDNDSVVATIDCGLNGTYVAASDDGDSFQCQFLDGGGPDTPATSSDVSIYVTDDEGTDSATDTQTVDIANANPVVAAPSFSATTICQGSTSTLTGISFSDAGTIDDPWGINIDWGDGSADYNASVATQGAQTSVSPTFNTPGTFTATVTVTDKDGGSGSNTSTNQVTVVAHYEVRFLQPVDGTTTGSVSNSVKLGRVVPIKIVVWDNCANDFAGAYVTDPATLVRLRAALAPASGGTILDTVEAYADAGQANNNTLYFRWTADASAPGGGFWIYNLDTKNSSQPKFELNQTYRIDASIGGVLGADPDSQYALLKMAK